MPNRKKDIIIIGAGLVGLSTAYHIMLTSPETRVLILEKESSVAQHQSGHNSGVIHSGIYYKPGSLKAENCISGYHSLIEFADKYKIPYEICGKIIVALSEGELKGLNNIYDRGIKNGLTNLKKMGAHEFKELEPHCSGIAAIHVPQTGIIDYPRMAQVLCDILVHEMGAEIYFNEGVNKISSNATETIVETDQNRYLTNKVVSCAGLFSDRMANLTESENDLRIIPFRGEYYKLRPEKEKLVKNLIYPVPDPNFPFLGVHFTRMINGGIEAGPNAVLAFKREGYKFSDFSAKDMYDTLGWPGFWKIVMKYGKTGLGEIYRSLSKKAFVKALQRLIPELTEEDLIAGGAGVRAQACDKNGNLIDDFNFLTRNNVIHVRNAPSPAATSSLAIGKLISEKVLK